FRLGTPHPCQARCVFVPAVEWPGNVLHDPDLAENFLSVHLDLTRSHFRASQLLDRTPVFAGATAHRRLAHSDLAFARRAGVRIFLGDVELLLLFEMPLLGYAGYIPFGLELYALTNFALPASTPFGASGPR